ncbi:MAG TPA: hypothetical protein ENO19_01470, partial [Halothiobacillaceae bacterium]|nr:hypothetical protein [Halothiobacillaceae bacterium]
RNQITELRERDLRFTAEEATAFLSQTMGLALPPKIMQALETRTEGWIAGLQLAALALQDMATRQGEEADTQTFIAAFSGDNRYVLDYLVTEVLHRQPAATRDFLCQTVILDRLTAPLCDAVTGRDDGQAMLDRLDAANLFLVPLDNRREWYRYHRLFAEVLRPALTSAEAGHLHQRAARWYAAQGALPQAIQHALARAATSGDAATDGFSDAERLIRQAAESTLHSGRVAAVRGWLDALPDARVRADSTLATDKGWILALTGDVEPAEAYADAAEACMRKTYPDAFPDAPDKRPRLGKVPAADLGKLWLLRGYIALGRRDYARATDWIDRALHLLKKEHPHWRVLGLWGLAEAQERTGDIAKAIVTLREARQIGQTGDDGENQVFAVVVEMSLAAALNSHGKRRDALAVCEQALERHTNATGHPSLLAGLIFTRMAMLHYEANQLEMAHQYNEKGLALSEPLAIDSLLMFSLGTAAPILYAHGEVEAALDAVQRAQRFASREALTDAHWLLATEADLRLRQGDLDFVAQWAATANLSPDDAPQYLRIEEHLVYARLLLAQGRLADARQWLARLERFTQERGLGRWLISVYILQALTEEAAGYRPTALERLTRAVQLAAPQEYVRAFLDEDARVLALLPDVRRVGAVFVGQILAAGGAIRDRPQRGADQALVEPLTDRELEVLGMLALGASNKEIAAKLFIATGTVKQHLKSIYGKLDVHNRTEATHRAGELGVL